MADFPVWLSQSYWKLENNSHCDFLIYLIWSVEVKQQRVLMLFAVVYYDFFGCHVFTLCSAIDKGG